MYDNLDSMEATRVLEYDPLTQAVPWVYANENASLFAAFLRGMKQRLPNGNTLNVDPDNRRLFEVTRDKELVWEIICPLPAVPRSRMPLSYQLTSARRYAAEDLTFLTDSRVRP